MDDQPFAPSRPEKEPSETDLLLLRMDLFRRFPHTLDPEIKSIYDQLVAEADAIAQVHAGFLNATLDTQKMLAELTLNLPNLMLLTAEQIRFLHTLSTAANRFYVIPHQQERGICICACFPCFRRVSADTVSLHTMLMLARDVADRRGLTLTEEELQREIDLVLEAVRKEEDEAESDLIPV